MNNLKIIEHQGKRVLTTQQLAQVYETESNNIVKNFSRNEDRFVDGRDYYLLQGQELKEFKGDMTNSPFAPNLNKLYLWTNRGANRHCKILDTDKAWQQFDALEETYQVNMSPVKKMLPAAEHETGFLNATEIGKRIGLKPTEANKLLEDNGLQAKIDGSWRLTDAGKKYAEEMPYLRHGHSGYQIQWNEAVVNELDKQED